MFRLLERRPNSEDPYLKELYEEILVGAIPYGELEELWSSSDVNDDDELLPVIVAVDESDRVLGGAVADLFGGSGVVLLSYLAVRSDTRGSGVGGALLDRAVNVWRTFTGTSLIVAEIDDPRFHVKWNSVDPDARIRFYAKNGTSIVDAPYFQPRLHHDTQRVYHAFMSVVWADPSLLRSRDSIDAALFHRLLNEYFEICEGRQVLDEDPEVKELLSAYDVETLRLIPIAEYAELSELHTLHCGHATVRD